MLYEFWNGLNRSGLTIPSQAPRVYATPEEHTPSDEPIPEAFPLMALAQHHGLPTMLLDWTRRGLVAAYFAAVDAVQSKHDASHLAVWGLNKGETAAVDRHIFYEAPGGTNPNLNAQAGLFTIHHAEDDPGLEGYLERRRAQGEGFPKLVRLLLPMSEAKDLGMLLADENITGASMFPGADGVVRSLRERSLWGQRVLPKGDGPRYN